MTTDVSAPVAVVPAQRRAPDTPPATPPVVWRARLITAILLLGALMFRQAPGQVVADTKLDLTADPGSFLLRALTLWDASQFGQLQNQAYGYLWPVGPFHWMLHAAGTPEWIIQRLWWTLILSVAFTGMWRLSGALGVGGPWTRYLGSIIFALSPRFQGEIAITSVEIWPMAVAPWVLAPLVDRRALPTRTRLARSTLALACVGGINAVATGAVLILPTLWFLTRRHRLTAARHLVVWLVMCVAAACWWLIPLLLMGRYSPPFLDWIEAASNTTSTTSPFTALQGTSTWVGWLVGPSGANWPAYRILIDSPLLTLVTTTPWILGLLGLMHPRCRERRFLALCVVVGLALTTAGFVRVPEASGFLAGPVRELLDGPLAPMRNIHKFELVIRIPLTLGFIHSSSVLSTMGRSIPAVTRAVVAGMLVTTLVAPAIVGALPAGGSYREIPAYWQEAAAWLDRSMTTGTALAVAPQPSSQFTWGTTKDHPLQALARRPYAVRDIVPLGSAGATRVLDAIGAQLRSGRGTGDLKGQLSSAGVAFVLVANDEIQQQGQEPLAIHQGLAEAGLRRVATFGPPVGSPIETSDTTVRDRTLLPYPSLEIFAVENPSAARLISTSDVAAGIGGPEDATRITAAVGTAASVRSLDTASAGRPLVLTDGLIKREAGFGIGNGETSPVLTAGEEGLQDRPVHDHLPAGSGEGTVRQWQGARSVTASSGASDVTAERYLGAAYGPAAAFDGDPATRWISDVSQEHPELTVVFDRPVDLSRLTASFSASTPEDPKPTTVRTITDTGERVVRVRPGRQIHLLVSPGNSRALTIRLEGVRGKAHSRGFAVNEIQVGDHPVTSALRLPHPDRAPAVVDLRSIDPGTDGCHYVGARPLCAPLLQRQPQEVSIRRLFTLPRSARYVLSGSVVSRPGPELSSLLDLPDRIRVAASSTGVQAPAARPGTLVDRDLGTGWTASADDKNPRLTLTLPRVRRITGLQLIRDRYLAGSMPSLVEVTIGGRAATYPVDRRGYVNLPTTRTNSLSVQIQQVTPLRSYRDTSGMSTTLPAGLSEIRLLGADDLRRPLSPRLAVDTRCGFGPDIQVDGHRLTTRVTGTVDQVLRRQPLTWTVCGQGSQRPLSLTAGGHQVVASASAQFMPNSLTLRRPGVPTRPSSPTLTPVTDQDPAADRGTYSVPARRDARLLVVDQNLNDGWRATTDDGTILEPVRVDGWKQGYLLPAGSATTITTAFVPQRFYRAGLGVGALALLGLVLVARRRVTPALEAGPLSPSSAVTGPACLTGAVLVVAAGWAGVIGVGLAVFVNGLHGVGLLPRRHATLVVSAALPLMTGAAWTALTTPNGQVESAAVQILVVCGVSVAVLSALRTLSSSRTELDR